MFLLFVTAAASAKDEKIEETYKCPRGRYMWDTFCQECSAGTYNPKEGSESITDCLPCPAMKVSTPGQAECHLLCPGGSYHTVAAVCQNCEAGKYNANVGSSSSSFCLPCPIGEYNPTIGQTACRKCPAGKTNLLPGEFYVGSCSLSSGSSSSSSSSSSIDGYYADYFNATISAVSRNYVFAAVSLLCVLLLGFFRSSGFGGTGSQRRTSKLRHGQNKTHMHAPSTRHRLDMDSTITPSSPSSSSSSSSSLSSLSTLSIERDCPVCRQPFQEARQLLCGHTYCTLCGQSMEKQHAINRANAVHAHALPPRGAAGVEVESNVNDDDLPRCIYGCDAIKYPWPRQGFETLPRNWALP